MEAQIEKQGSVEVDVAMLIARLVAGTVFMAHGSQKLLGFFGGSGFHATIEHMGALGYLLIAGEFFGGLGLILGFLSRFSAASITAIMIGAIMMVHGKNGFFMNWTGKQAGEGFEYHLLAIGLLLTIAIIGPGRLTIGRFLPFPKSKKTGLPVILIE